MLLSGLIVGVLFGAILQRGRFCVTGQLRDIFLNRSWRGFTALMVLLSVHSFGLTLAMSLGWLTPEFSNLSPLAVIIGGLVFGMGIVLAGGCASGTSYRFRGGACRLVDRAGVLRPIRRCDEGRPAQRRG